MINIIKDKWISIVANLSKPAKAAIAFIIIGLLHSAILMLSSPIFTRLLETSEYGEVAVFNAYFRVLWVFATLSLNTGAFNNGMIEFRKDKHSFIKSIIILSNITTILVIAAIIFLSSVFDSLVIISNNLMVLIVIILILKPAYNAWLSDNKFSYHYRVPFVLTLISVLVSVCMSVVFTLIFPNPVEGRLWGNYLVMFLVWSCFYYKYIFNFDVKVKLKYMIYALKINIPLIPHYLSKFVLNSFDQIMISEYVNKSALGIYNVAYTVGFGVKIIWEAINSILTPWIFIRIEDNREKEIEILFNFFVVLYGLICLMISLLAPEIMKILAPSNYFDGVYIIPIILSGALVVGISGWFSIVIFYYKKTKVIMTISVFVAMLNIVLNYFMIPKYGYIAAATTTLISFIVQNIVYAIYVRILNRCIFNVLLIQSVQYISITINILAIIFYRYFFIRIIIVILMFTVLYYILKKINLVFKE